MRLVTCKAVALGCGEPFVGGAQLMPAWRGSGLNAACLRHFIVGGLLLTFASLLLEATLLDRALVSRAEPGALRRYPKGGCMLGLFG